MTSGYYCAIFPFCGGGKKKKKKKDDKKTKAFYDWATTGILVITIMQMVSRVKRHVTGIIQFCKILIEKVAFLF